MCQTCAILPPATYHYTACIFLLTGPSFPARPIKRGSHTSGLRGGGGSPGEDLRGPLPGPRSAMSRRHRYPAGAGRTRQAEGLSSRWHLLLLLTAASEITPRRHRIGRRRIGRRRSERGLLQSRLARGRRRDGGGGARKPYSGRRRRDYFHDSSRRRRRQADGHRIRQGADHPRPPRPKPPTRFCICTHGHGYGGGTTTNDSGAGKERRRRQQEAATAAIFIQRRCGRCRCLFQAGAAGSPAALLLEANG